RHSFSPYQRQKDLPFRQVRMKCAVPEKKRFIKKTGDGIYYCKANETEWTADELRTLIEERDANTLEVE
ncbi:MAG: hypothetical protein K2I93_00300, partial [Oscillospiraceae bacterium]|nr:hypothetical protein [Oscillospiraceae bacterium]